MIKRNLLLFYRIKPVAVMARTRYWISRFFQFSDVSKTAEQLIQLTGSALSSGVQRTGSANADNLKGSVLADTLLGLAGNDTLSGLGGGDTLNGGDGLDTVVYLGASSGFQVKRGSSEVLVSENGVQDHLLQVERIQFSDKTLALDIDATAGKAYRVYQAAFNRTPDTGGLKYWISKMDGGLTLDGVASGFVPARSSKHCMAAPPARRRLCLNCIPMYCTARQMPAVMIVGEAIGTGQDQQGGGLGTVF